MFSPESSPYDAFPVVLKAAAHTLHYIKQASAGLSVQEAVACH